MLRRSAIGNAPPSRDHTTRRFVSRQTDIGQSGGANSLLQQGDSHANPGCNADAARRSPGPSRNHGALTRSCSRANRAGPRSRPWPTTARSTLITAIATKAAGPISRKNLPADRRGELGRGRDRTVSVRRIGRPSREGDGASHSRPGLSPVARIDRLVVSPIGTDNRPGPIAPPARPRSRSAPDRRPPTADRRGRGAGRVAAGPSRP